jgi:hypothetical protein
MAISDDSQDQGLLDEDPTLDEAETVDEHQ